MKIAFVGLKGLPALYGGVEKHVEELGTRLAERGHSIIVYSRRNYNNYSGFYKGMRVFSLPTVSEKHTEMITHTFLSLLDLLDKEVDIVHIHSVDPALISFIPRLKTKVIVTSHGQAYRRAKWGVFAKKISRLAERAFIYLPDKRIAVSKTLQHYYQQKYGCEVIYIPNGIEVAQKQGRDELKKFGLNQDDYFLFVGRLIPTKGCATLIKAFAQIKTNKKLVICGGSSYTDDYYKYLKQQADDRVLFLGYRYGEELAQLYANAYCFVMPSEIEGLAFSLLEAMSYARCVIFSDIPENVEVAEGVGISFRNRDVVGLTEKLNFVLGHPDLVKQLGRKAQHHIREHYNWEDIVTRTEEVYDALFR